MAPDLLSKIRDEIDERLSEMGPVLAEYERLLLAADALVTDSNGSSPKKDTNVSANGAPRGSRDGGQRRGSAADATRRAPAAQIAEEHSGGEPAKQSKAVKDRSPAAPSAGNVRPKAERAARGAAREAILAALEHGSHTVGELVVVTAMSAPNINGNLRKLISEGAVVKTEREGKAAWVRTNALAGVA
jgi:DNA-binding transcriptional ArsR family regulator